MLTSLASCQLRILLAIAIAATATGPVTMAQEQTAAARAQQTEAKMTDAERFSLIISLMPVLKEGGRDRRVPANIPGSAAYVPGVPRLGVPALRLTDSSLGVTNPGGSRPGDSATALPAGLALGATFNRTLAHNAGAMVGREARAKGFNVLLGGGMNLVRDPRNGRNFEYISEDPLLSAVIASEAIRGTQEQGVISMVKHVSLNANETNRHRLNAVIDPIAHRESDLLAFQMAIEWAQPGSVMCAYNKVNGDYSCGNEILLNEVLKKTWKYPGWVMSDWAAVHNWDYALKGLDQESGAQLDKILNGEEFFDKPLKTAYAEGKLPKERLSDMVRRILHSIYALGLDKPSPAPALDLEKDKAETLEVERQAIVLLKNDKILPLSTSVKSIAVIGGQADRGVPTGGGSSTVTPPGGFSASIPMGGEYFVPDYRIQNFLPSSPLAELKKQLPEAKILFDAGAYPADAAALARRSEIAIVFVTRHENEAFDSPDLTLPYGQDAVVQAVATANPNTIVVLETGNPIAMPWGKKVKAIAEAWFPGLAGAQAIADVLTGKINPSGRLPITFPADIAQTPRPELPGFGTPVGTPVTVYYNEGSEIGYRWFFKRGETPLYPFGYGLSYTTFSYGGLKIIGGETVTATFTVTNDGSCEGADVPQLYLTDAAGDKRMRLLGFDRVDLRPGQSRTVTVTTDPRLLARFDASGQWRIAEGTYRVALGSSAGSLLLQGDTTLTGRSFGN